MTITPQDMDGLRRSARHGARWTGVATAVRVVTQFVQVAILARLLTPEDFGLMAMAGVVVAFAQAFGDFGISNAIIHYQDATREELSSLYWLNVIAGVVVGAIVYALAPLAGMVFRQEMLPDLVRLAAPLFLIVPVGHQFQLLLERALRFRPVAAVETVSLGLGTIVGIVFAYRGAGVDSLVFGLLAQALVRAVMLAVYGWREWPPQFRLVWSECTRFVRFGMFQMGEKVLSVLGQQLDRLVIGVTMGEGPLGFYEMAYRLIARPYQVINPIFTRVAFPVFSRVQGDVDRVRKGFLEMLEVIAVIIAPLYFVMAAVAPSLTMAQFGPGWEPCIKLIRILSIVGFFYAIGNPLGTVLLARGRADVAFYMNALRLVLYGAALWFGSRFGLEGIAWGLVIALIAVLFPVGLWIRWWLIRMRPGEYLARIAPSVAIAAVTAGAIVLGGSRITWPNAWVELIVLTATGGLCVFLLMLITGRERLRRLRAMLST